MTAASVSPFRVASYNLQKCVGLDLRRRPGRSLKVIEALGADLVVLQEADKRLPPRPAALPHGLVEAHGWQVLPFGQVGGSLGWHGNAMLAQPGITVLHTDHIDLPGLEPRGAICADLDTRSGPLRVVGTHLGLIRRHRLLQLAAIRRHLDTLAPMRTLIAGDFNEWGNEQPLSAQLGNMQVLATPASYPAPRPIAGLDRFALSPDLTVVSAGVHRQRPARIASDHLPVWLDLVA
ncbi:endonuclease/exonuclease/phosphatase family protein [Thalassobius sp. Cn5-15]|uniref:endonuclease/exonuclease/phosphatase family protein n=1 Tax=Thalassobius sp. Cn5-15 TaxID=2917763 RepID=UPI001EF17E9A|nr:endonuclease/exonuclease/phosphatase family protein [Thalassobius sp. Cn5-15]MCG7492320.1 endonuclease/exonuclease/phosphatase family protein [Thalassobius sp. Cn5-15]